MNKILIILAIIIVLAIILFFIFRKKNNLLSSPPNEEQPSQQVKTLYTELTRSFNNLLEYVGDIDISTGGISGNLNNLNLNNIVSGSGIQRVDIGIDTLNINYNFKDLILLNFAKSLKFTGTQIRINEVKNNSQLITLYLQAKAKQLNCKISAHAQTKPIGSATIIEGNCNNTPVVFNDVICNLQVNFILTNCDNLLSTVSSIILDVMDISFNSVNIRCDVSLKFLNIFNFPLANLDIGDLLLSTIKSNIFRIKDALAPLFNSQFKNINIPSLPCIRLYPGCLLGINVQPKHVYASSDIENLTWPECKDLCDNNPKCNYVFHSGTEDQRGQCVFYNTIGPVHTGPVRGFYYNKNTKEIKQGIPYPGKLVLVDWKTKEFDNLECANICKSNNSCIGFAFENNFCSLYDNAGLQNVTLKLSDCQRSVKTPDLFV
jgi:hypothetical protein